MSKEVASECVKINNTQREELLSLKAQLLGFKFRLYYNDAANNENDNSEYMYELIENNGDRIFCSTLDILESYLNKLKMGKNND